MATEEALLSMRDQISADPKRRHALFEWESRFTNIHKIRKYLLRELNALISEGVVVDEAGVIKHYDEIEKLCKKLIRRRLTTRFIHGVEALSDEDGGSHSEDLRDNCARGSHANNREDRGDCVLSNNRRLGQNPNLTNDENIIQDSDQQINPDDMANENSSDQHDNRGSDAHKDNNDGQEGHEDDSDSHPDQDDHHGQAELPCKNLGVHQENDLCQANGNNEGTTAGPSNADENPGPDHEPKGPHNNHDPTSKRTLIKDQMVTKARTRSQTRTSTQPFLAPPPPPPATLGLEPHRDKRSRYNGNVTPSPTTPEGSLKRPCLVDDKSTPEFDLNGSWPKSPIEQLDEENHELHTGADPLDTSLPVLDCYPESEKEQPQDEPEAEHDGNNDDGKMADGTDRDETCRQLEGIPLDTNTKGLIEELQDRIEGWKPRPGRPNPAVVDKIKKMKDHFKEAFKGKMEELFTKGEKIDFNDKKRIASIVDEITEQAFKLHQSAVSPTIKKFVRNSLIQLLVRQFIKKTW